MLSNACRAVCTRASCMHNGWCRRCWAALPRRSIGGSEGTISGSGWGGNLWISAIVFKDNSYLFSIDCDFSRHPFCIELTHDQILMHDMFNMLDANSCNFTLRTFKIVFFLRNCISSFCISDLSTFPCSYSRWLAFRLTSASINVLWADCIYYLQHNRKRFSTSFFNYGSYYWDYGRPTFSRYDLFC